MGIELIRLVKKVKHMDISLIAGENGIHNMVTWVHMVETTEASSFLEGGEIAFITGLGITGKVSLLTLTQSIYNNHAAGLIINIGPFIEHIPDEVINFCNKNAFPLLIVPWKTHLAEIMRIFCFAITKEEQKSMEVTAGFKNAIFFPKQEELYVIPLSSHNFHVNWNYSVCVVHLDHIKGLIPNRLESLVFSLNNYMKHNYDSFSIFSQKHELLAVVAVHSEEKLHSFINDLQEHAKLLLQEGETLSLGVGKITKSIRCLYKSYHQAKSIQMLHERDRIPSSLIFYSDMGIYKLLMAIDDHDILNDYYEKTLLPLLEYDKKNESDLANVLHCYLNHNGSVKETANELFVHRNTINYKLNKIEELLGIDLASLDIRLQFSVAFMLKDML